MAIKNIARTAAALLVAILCASGANAALISWDKPVDTTAASDVLTSGSLVQAVNAGAAVVGSVTVNGVSFTNAASVGTLSRSFTRALPEGSTGDEGFDSILNTFSHWGENPGSLTLGGLLSGREYLLQVFWTDTRPNGNRVLSFGLDGNEVDGAVVELLSQGSLGTGIGQSAVGSFTADGTSSVLGITQIGVDGLVGTPRINAYQVRLLNAPVNRSLIVRVPAPMTLALLALGLAGIGFQQRRFSRQSQANRCTSSCNPL